MASFSRLFWLETSLVSHSSSSLHFSLCLETLSRQATSLHSRPCESSCLTCDARDARAHKTCTKHLLLARSHRSCMVGGLVMLDLAGNLQPRTTSQQALLGVVVQRDINILDDPVLREHFTQILRVDPVTDVPDKQGDLLVVSTATSAPATASAPRGRAVSTSAPARRAAAVPRPRARTATVAGGAGTGTRAHVHEREDEKQQEQMLHTASNTHHLSRTHGARVLLRIQNFACVLWSAAVLI